MTVPSYTEEDVELVALRLHSQVCSWLPTDHKPTWPHGVCDDCRPLARAILAALSSAGRLVPPGSEVREEWGTRRILSDGSPMDWAEMSERTARRIMRDRSGPTTLLRRLRIVTPWSPSVPDTKEES